MGGDSIKITVKFTATASMEVPLSLLDPDNYDLQDFAELREAVKDWAADNFVPAQCYSDYSGRNQIICVCDMPADLEVLDEMEYLVGDETEEID